MAKVVVLSGAGISAESGFSTFRDSDGLWNKFKVEDVATPEGYARNPQLVLDFYNGLRRDLYKAEPNKGHLELAELERDFDVSIITQNVDDLHERAGSSDVLHLHGELKKARACGDPEMIIDLTEGEDIGINDKAPDGSALRPHIVWFGEAVPNISLAQDLVKQADIFLIVGTSLNVYPAAGLISYVRRGTPIFLVDPKPVSVPHYLDVRIIAKKASEGIACFADMIRHLK
ncbi:MAG: NAD-dependent deacylase [Paludibacteraceae bacterium]|jgi:NAD-dependent deacetylase|nr:NAD-dependent deacylase [Paludibacteraceae bacterium]MBO5863617.1 NAD-dependent deacylase [Paludibacteraceae bacterium]MEE0996373.1 NAD-dependent deacylase [Paludibacteraceae bacterium]